MHNPPLYIETYKANGTSVKVIRDDVLIAGTKQRAVIPYLQTLPDKELVYSGPSTGYGYIALAYGCHALGRRCTAFLQTSSQHKNTAMTALATKLGANLFFVEDTLKVVQQQAEDYSVRADGYVVPFGFDNSVYQQLLADAIRVAGVDIPQPRRMWLASGSGTLLKALHDVWPTTQYHVVQVGRNVVVDFECTVYKSPLRFFQATRERPPYPSVLTYDAKVWQFVKRHAEDGDYVWNVAC
jgi:hypothetical protein